MGSINVTLVNSLEVRGNPEIGGAIARYRQVKPQRFARCVLWLFGI